MNLNPLRGAGRPAMRRGLTVAAAAVLGSGALAVVATQASAAAGCRVDYSVNQWNTGFTANLVVTNLGGPINGWTLEWEYSGNQRITQAWNSDYTQSGTRVTLRNAAWNASLGTNTSAYPGFNASYSGTNTAPTSFWLNGTACTGQVGTPPPPTPPPPTTPPPTTPPPTTPPPTTPPPTTPPPTGGPRVDNPYVGVRGYVNPEWKAKAESVPGGSRVSNTPTGVWLDRIAAIEGTANSESNGPMGVADHLDAALAQGAGYIQFVIYNLPARDCSALASNGELGIGELGRYKSEYIDAIAAIQGDAKYRDLRIVNIVEIDSLPNLVTNAEGAAGTEMCRQVKQQGVYRDGVAYAIDKLGAIPNVYNYIDAAHHAWIGWDSNFLPSAQLFAEVGRLGGLSKVHGFITNTANYSATVEPYFTINTTVNGQSIRQSSFIDWNQYVDERSFAQAFRQELIRQGFDSNIGMLIDTSRNGWGGSGRPTGPSSASDVNTFVNQSRIDRRIHPGNWCNQSGAGLGERPTAAPAAGIDAYVWIKPPGESDGSSELIPNDDGKGFDRMCDPTYTGNIRNGNSMSGALPNAPISGAWFAAQFQELMTNAHPPLS